MVVMLIGSFVLLLTALMVVMGGVYDPFAFGNANAKKALLFVLGLLLTIWMLVWIILGIKVEVG